MLENVSPICIGITDRGISFCVKTDMTTRDRHVCLFAVKEGLCPTKFKNSRTVLVVSLSSDYILVAKLTTFTKRYPLLAMQPWQCTL